ncbi:hypothetical protein N7478_000141 [Penicillium angulare]|uniref:uncharacterized protein n=1 Tax=Penicillium angulare TaxID=116970 RepID=UPI002540C91F|nr:uncharacterized protein N7478_000141 [Penicillium angulare]KAJ5290890.1 hypothetical protein N7478_000141 [Penicillium angulare]
MSSTPILRTRIANATRIQKYTSCIRSTLSSAGRKINDQLRQHGPFYWEGSPWDEPEHRDLAIADMDLNRTYANDPEYRVPAVEPEARPPRQQRWTQVGRPLTDRTQLPEGWNTDEPDLDPNAISSRWPAILGWSGRIQINGLVTYWSRGTQISQPRPFDWDECLAINNHHNGTTSFWVEGYNIAVKLPGVDWWSEFKFGFDTGCDQMELFERDLTVLQGPHNLGVVQTLKSAY